MLKLFSDWLTYSIFRIGKGTLLAGAVNYFIYDTAKIFLLLIVIIFAVSMIRSFFSAERTRAILAGKGLYTGNVLASLLGIVTPFCSYWPYRFSWVLWKPGYLSGSRCFSCGVTHDKRSGACYVVGDVRLEDSVDIYSKRPGHINYIRYNNRPSKGQNLVEDFVFKPKTGAMMIQGMTFMERVIYARDYTLDILKNIWPYVIIGIGLGAWIHGYVPQDFL